MQIQATIGGDEMSGKELYELDQKVLKKIIDLMQEEYGDQHLERTGGPELKLRFVLNTFNRLYKNLEQSALDQAYGSSAVKFLVSELDEATAATAALSNSDISLEKILSFFPDTFDKKKDSVIYTISKVITLGLQEGRRHQ